MNEDSFVHVIADEFFDEKIYIRPLNDGKVYTHFQFKTLLEDAVPRLPNSPSQKDEAQHYVVSPLALGQILRSYAVTELHFSLNAGKWDYRTWRYPNSSSVGNGAELWVWMREDETHKCVFSYSINKENNQTSRLTISDLMQDGRVKLDTFHQTSSYSGIAALLNPHRLFGADWHGVGIQALWDAEKGIEIELSVQAVFDPVRLHGRKDRSWSFSHLFGKSIQGRCSVARDSRIEADLPSSPFTLAPPPPITNEVAQ
ncbi:hypothetical protein Clacol_003013 [Clathrus columnatus]|uniref:Uncharacterized protein n=1 Tax=Clathrus columnatus TaxID=1419009 RepID=A0AAV5A6B9_9AGAM|nr:hypothetical protein Clacol_003013 [Clathrus columnatus]